MKKFAIIRGSQVEDVSKLPVKSLDEEIKKLINEGYEVIDKREFSVFTEKEGE